MKTSKKVHQITLTAILAAIIVLMAFTPLGYLRLGVVSITFLTIPVVVGGMVLGPLHGGILGAVFGLTSLAQCFMGDVFGASLFALNPAGTVAACLIPRILIGVVAGVLFPALRRLDKAGIVSFVLTAIAGALTNTVLFVGMVIAFFQNSYFGGSPVLEICAIFFTFNAALEVVICGVVAAGLSKALTHVVCRDAAAPAMG